MYRMLRIEMHTTWHLSDCRQVFIIMPEDFFDILLFKLSYNLFYFTSDAVI